MLKRIKMKLERQSISNILLINFILAIQNIPVIGESNIFFKI